MSRHGRGAVAAHELGADLAQCRAELGRIEHLEPPGETGDLAGERRDAVPAELALHPSVAPGRPVERFAREASAYAKERLLGKKVYLAYDRELRDAYGRLLAYVFLEDGSCFDL